MNLLWIIGAGGHAKVVIDAAQAMGSFAVAGVLDDQPERWGSEVLGVRVCGPASPETVRHIGGQAETGAWFHHRLVVLSTRCLED